LALIAQARVAGDVRLEDLQRNVPAERRVLGAVEPAAPAGQRRQELIGAEPQPPTPLAARFKSHDVASWWASLEGGKPRQKVREQQDYRRGRRWLSNENRDVKSCAKP